MIRHAWLIPLVALVAIGVGMGTLPLSATGYGGTPGSGIRLTDSPSGNVTGGSSGPVVSCPAGSTLSWGPIGLNCFQSLDITEIVALLLGIGISVYIYWDSDQAELPGDSAEVPLTTEEELQRKKRSGETPP